MKSFRTIVPPWRAPFQLTHADPLLLVGSCFTEHIGRKLAEGKFDTLVNPNGIVYNPVSIAGTTKLRFVEKLAIKNEPEVCFTIGTTTGHSTTPTK
ncbi:MAG: GSCFA domain-containing protein [Lewinellaceae bacterium]|nr:GSCFA domain-containing protein [Lewinellaceae bacterium]